MGSGSTTMPSVVSEHKPAAPEIATNHESDSDAEMMALAAKHGDDLGTQKAKNKVATTKESDSDSEMMSLLAKYGDQDQHYQPVVALQRLPSRKEAKKRQKSKKVAKVRPILVSTKDKPRSGDSDSDAE